MIEAAAAPGHIDSMSGTKALASVWVALVPFTQAVAVDSPGDTAFTQHAYPISLTQVKARLQPIARLGAAPDRVDVAHPTDAISAFAPDLSPNGSVAYGEIDLPLRSHGIEVHAIAGILPLKGILNAIVSVPGVSACPGCDLQPFPPHHAETGLTGGAGTQFKLGSWALRFDCQCFIGTGGRPGFVSLGFTRNF
jgi:hypothetical protein